MPERMSEYTYARKNVRVYVCQKECQSIRMPERMWEYTYARKNVRVYVCQKECQSIRMPERMSEYTYARKNVRVYVCQKECQSIRMPERMSEYTYARKNVRVYVCQKECQSIRMPERMSEYTYARKNVRVYVCQKECQIECQNTHPIYTCIPFRWYVRKYVRIIESQGGDHSKKVIVLWANVWSWIACSGWTRSLYVYIYSLFADGDVTHGILGISRNV